MYLGKVTIYGLPIETFGNDKKWIKRFRSYGAGRMWVFLITDISHLRCLCRNWFFDTDISHLRCFYLKEFFYLRIIRT